MKETLFLAAALGCAIAPVRAGHHEQKREHSGHGSHQHGSHRHGSAPAGMEQMMKNMQEYGTPGAEHARLATLAGRWNAAMTMWMRPGDAPQASKGTTRFEPIFGGRYLKQELSADWAGQKFEGLGYTGYDRVRKEYFSTFMDSLGTGIAISRGKASGGVINDEGSFACPMTGEKDRWFRGEWELPEDEKDDTSVFRMFHKDEKGKEYKAMEIVYTRVH